MEARLKPIADKVLAGERLGQEEGVALFETEDIFTLGRLANHVRRERHGNRVTYVKNMHLNYSNICIHTCTFCAFARKPGEEGGWEMSVDDILAAAEKIRMHRLSEVHIVGGIHPRLPYAYYTDMLRALKAKYPHVHIKAFTAVEIEHLAKIGRRSIRETLVDLCAAGLDSLPGGGAEIFSRRVWDEICGTKTRPEKWLEIHKAAHELGIRSTCTMLYGHIETAEERVEHMLRLRALQDETGGFTTFIPLAFQPEKTVMSHIPEPTGLTDLRCHAVARLMMDNVDHVKAYWVMTGVKMAQTLLHFGVDDIDGTVEEERIVHMAGADSPVGLTEAELRRLIREAGFTPVLRDTLYRPVEDAVLSGSSPGN